MSTPATDGAFRTQDAADEPLERLLAERAALVESAKDLHARYGPYGTCTEVRENLRAELAVEYRARLADHLGKITQAVVDEAVRTDERYVSFIREMEEGRARLYVFSDRIKAVDHRIRRYLASIGAGAMAPAETGETPITSEGE
jgi:chromosome segregation ATPase